MDKINDCDNVTDGDPTRWFCRLFWKAEERLEEVWVYFEEDSGVIALSNLYVHYLINKIANLRTQQLKG